MVHSPELDNSQWCWSPLALKPLNQADSAIFPSNSAPENGMHGSKPDLLGFSVVVILGGGDLDNITPLAVVEIFGRHNPDFLVVKPKASLQGQL